MGYPRKCQGVFSPLFSLNGVALAKQGDKALGSVRPSICPYVSLCALSALPFALLVDLGNDHSLKGGPILYTVVESFQGKALGGWVGQKSVQKDIKMLKFIHLKFMLFIATDNSKYVLPFNIFVPRE